MRFFRFLIILSFLLFAGCSHKEYIKQNIPAPVEYPKTKDYHVQVHLINNEYQFCLTQENARIMLTNFYKIKNFGLSNYEILKHLKTF